jgi:hypothetical protein
MGIIRAKVFPSKLRGGVRAESLCKHLIFTERHFFGGTVNRRARRENELSHSMRFGGFEKMKSSFDVRVEVKLRIVHRGPDPRASRQMHNGVWFLG